jgi:signal transduction histidine kinase
MRRQRGGLKLARLLAAALVAAAALDPRAATAASTADASGPQQVLVLTGSDPYLPAFVAIDGAMRDALARLRARPVAWAHESIDTMRFGGALMPALASVLHQKYAGVRLDAIVLVSETAVDFHLRHGHVLWPGVPVVFHSVAPDYAAALPAGHGMSGVVSEVDYAGSVRLALALQPGARRLLVIAGNSAFDQMQLEAARRAVAAWSGRVGVEILAGLTPAALAARLAQEAPDTAVLFVSLMRDEAGQIHAPRNVLQAVAASSAAPIYGAYESYVGHGLVAGSIEPFQQRGERVAALLGQVLDGRLPGAGVIEPARLSRCVADARLLERFGLDASALPADCELRFVEPSFLGRYWWQSLLVVVTLLAQSALIAALLLQLRRRRTAEASLQAQRVQLLHASRLAVAGELTASIAHEINQPLGAILANADAAEMLLGSGRMPREELLQILADIRRDDLRASEVIKRLRALLARHETERRRFDLNGAVEDVVAIVRAEARRRGVTVESALHARDAVVLGDPVQIQQVIINLMLNAFDASAGAPEEARRVRIETVDTPAGVQLGVRDFGSGIASADLPRIFDSFYSTKQGGMGLGLAITRSIVESHGGTITAANRNPGAEFVVHLPSAPAADGPGRAATQAP